MRDFVSSDEAQAAHPDSVQRHLDEMLRNRESWNRRPVLRKIYETFYREIALHLADPRQGRIVELGSGIGVAKEFIPNCITTDIFPNPWLDRVENAYQLSFSDESIGNLILFDVFHHLKYPGSALDEFWRAVAPHGRIILFEPAMGVVGKLIYGLFHHEPLGLNAQIELFPERSERPSEHGYYAAQGNAWRLFVKNEKPQIFTRWNLTHRETLCAISYVLSGGFSKPCVYPLFLLPTMQLLDKLLHGFPVIFGTRLLVVLEKRPVIHSESKRS